MSSTNSPSAKWLLLSCVLLSLALSGCTSATQSSEESTPTMPSLQESVACSDDLKVSFWALNEKSLWNAGELRWGGTVPATNSTYFFVGFVGGEVAGISVEEGGGGDTIAVDGGRISLDQTYRGTHTAKIIVFKDSKRNGQFDIDNDQPCSNGSTLVGTRDREIDFSQVDG